MDLESQIAAYEKQESGLVLTSFDQDDAWELGSLIVERARSGGYGVGIEIRRPGGFIVFRATLPGSSPDQEHWLRRKAAVALRVEQSSALLDLKCQRMGIDAAEIGWLSAEDYAVTGGAVPVRVSGVGVVAAVAVSGLTSEEDHQLIIDCLQEFKDLQDGAANQASSTSE